MQNKKNLSEITVIPAHVAADAGRFTSSLHLTQLSFWGKLTARKQEQIKEEINQLAAARIMHASSGLAIGKHLQNIYDTCEPYSGAFRNLVKSFNFVERTAYRYMKTYENAKLAFPETILKAAIARGLNILSYNNEQPLGKYTEAVKLLPPPREADPTQAKRYLDQLEQTYKDRKKALGSDSETAPPVGQQGKKVLLKSSFRTIRNALKQIAPRQRRAFLDDLFGMALTEAGIASKVTFSPEAIPEDFSREAGRPPLESAA